MKDESFKTFEDRPNLLTKREIRIQILADLELPEDGVIWDIGAGCGSIGLEALRLRPNLKLFCFDKRLGSKDLIKENARRLEVFQTKIYEENINSLILSGYLKSLQKADRVVVGGCDKETKINIINNLSRVMNYGDIIVFPIIDIQIIKDLKLALIKNNFTINLNLIQTYKSLTIS